MGDKLFDRLLIADVCKKILLGVELDSYFDLYDKFNILIIIG